jgi:hypothetical protein
MLMHLGYIKCLLTVLTLERWSGEYALAVLRDCDASIITSDVTNADAVTKTHAEIRKSMPPIGGVAQGASKSSGYGYKSWGFVTNASNPASDS